MAEICNSSALASTGDVTLRPSHAVTAGMDDRLGTNETPRPIGELDLANPACVWEAGKVIVGLASYWPSVTENSGIRPYWEMSNHQRSTGVQSALHL